MNEMFYKHYVFLNEINDLIKVNLLKFSNIHIIINISQNDKKNLKNQHLIIKFAKKNKIPFLFKNNFQTCIKYKANGIFIDSVNKNIIRPIMLKDKFEIIGSAHDQLEYNNKKNQKCGIIMLSPLFYNEKYSKNKILNIHKFNLMSLNWRINICALGGINFNNYKKIKMTKSSGIAFVRLIKFSLNKKAHSLF